MIAQLYEDGMCRIFDKKGRVLCDVYVTDGATTAEADLAFKRIRMERRGKWKNHRAGGFRDVSVRFAPK